MEFFEDDIGVSGEDAVHIYCTPEAINAYEEWVTYPMRSLYENDAGTTVTSIMRAFANDHLGEVEFPLRDFSVRISTPNGDEDDDFFVSVDPRNRTGWYTELTRQVAEALGVPAVTLVDEEKTNVNSENITHVIEHHGDRFVAFESNATPPVVAMKIDARITSSMSVDDQMRVYATELAQRVYDTNDKEELRAYTQDPHLAYNVAVAVSKQCGLDAILHVSFGCHRKTFYERVASFIRAHVRNTVDSLSSTKVSSAPVIRSFTKEFRDLSFAAWIQSAISPAAPVEEEESSASEEDELVGTTIDCEYTMYSDSSDDEAPIAANALLKTFKNVITRSKYVSFKLERTIQKEKPKDFSWTGTTSLEPGDIIHTFLHAAGEVKTKMPFSLRRGQSKPPPTSVIIDVQMKNRREQSAKWLVVFTSEMMLPTKGTSPGVMFTVPLDDSLYRIVVSLRRPGDASLMFDEDGRYEFVVDAYGTKSAVKRNYPVTWEQIRSARYNQDLRREQFVPEFVFHARVPTLAPFPHRTKKLGEIIDYFPPEQPQLLEDERSRVMTEQRSIGVAGYIKHLADIVKYKSYAINEVRAVIWTHANNRTPYTSAFLQEAMQEYDSEYVNVPAIGVKWNEKFSFDLTDSGASEFAAALGLEPTPPVVRPKIDWNEDFSGGFGSDDSGASEFAAALGLEPSNSSRTTPPVVSPKIDWNEDFSGRFGSDDGGASEFAVALGFGSDSPPRAASSAPALPPIVRSNIDQNEDFGVDVGTTSPSSRKPQSAPVEINWNEDFGASFSADTESGFGMDSEGLGAKAPQTIGGRTVIVPPIVWSGVIDSKSAAAFGADPSRALAGGRPFVPAPSQPQTRVTRQPAVQRSSIPKLGSTPTPVLTPAPRIIPQTVLDLDENEMKRDFGTWLRNAKTIYDLVLKKKEIPYDAFVESRATNLQKERKDYNMILNGIYAMSDDAARLDNLHQIYEDIQDDVGVESDTLADEVRNAMLNWIQGVKAGIKIMRDSTTTPEQNKGDFDGFISEVEAQEQQIPASTIPPEDIIIEIKLIEDAARNLHGTFNVPTAAGAASSSSGDAAILGDAGAEPEQVPTTSRISIDALFSQLNAEQQSIDENVVERVVDEAVSYVALAGASVTHGFDKVLGAVFRRNDPKYFGGVFRAGKRYLTVIPDKVRWDEILESIRNEETEYVDFVNGYTFEIAPGTLFSHSRPVTVTSLDGKHTLDLKRTYSKTNNRTIIQVFDRSGVYFGTMDTNVYTETYKIHTVKVDG